MNCICGASWHWRSRSPVIDATSYRAGQAIRPAVVSRKVRGVNRTWPGAKVQSILMSVIRTSQQRAVDPFDFLTRALCAPKPQLLPAAAARRQSIAFQPQLKCRTLNVWLAKLKANTEQFWFIFDAVNQANVLETPDNFRQCRSTSRF